MITTLLKSSLDYICGLIVKVRDLSAVVDARPSHLTEEYEEGLLEELSELRQLKNGAEKELRGKTEQIEDLLDENEELKDRLNASQQQAHHQYVTIMDEQVGLFNNQYLYTSSLKRIQESRHHRHG